MQEILLQRAEIVKDCLKSVEAQIGYKEICKQDILFWFKNFVYTDKNDSLYWPEMPNILPFIPYPFQEECILEVWDSICKGEPVFIEKSRQMGISWLIMAVFVYGRCFHNHKYLVLSQKQDDVDKLWDMKSLFEKARFIINNLPQWMLPKGFNKKEDMNYMNISGWETTGSITGESANPNASRWGTYNAIFPDEFAFQSNAATINRAMASASPCRIYTSTPNGKGNEHYRMRLLAMPNDGSEPSIKWLRYYWSDHPLYTKERYNKKTASMDSVTIAQELEIDYDTAVMGRVYPEFPKESINIKYNPDKPLYVCIDNSHGWTDPNAVILAQIEGSSWNCIDSLEMNATPEDMAYFLSCNPKGILTDIQSSFLERYKNYNWKKATFIADPYDTKQAMGNSTILDDYKKVGINLMIPEERRKEEQILKTRTNLYKVRYNDNCLDMASAILNARYPERKEDSNSTKPFMLPVHNRTSHYRTALEYLVTFLCENPMSDKPQIARDMRPYKDKMTWRIICPQ